MHLETKVVKMRLCLSRISASNQNTFNLLLKIDDEIFGMPLNLFQKLEWWRQRQMKRRVGLSNVQSAFRQF